MDRQIIVGLASLLVGIGGAGMTLLSLSNPDWISATWRPLIGFLGLFLIIISVLGALALLAGPWAARVVQNTGGFRAALARFVLSVRRVRLRSPIYLARPRPVLAPKVAPAPPAAVAQLRTMYRSYWVEAFEAGWQYFDLVVLRSDEARDGECNDFVSDYFTKFNQRKFQVSWSSVNGAMQHDRPLTQEEFAELFDKFRLAVSDYFSLWYAGLRACRILFWRSTTSRPRCVSPHLRPARTLHIVVEGDGGVGGVEAIGAIRKRL